MVGIAVKLKEDFSVIKETLERIGVKKKTKIKNFIYPSCYCVETTTEGVYKIVHFKELLKFSGREVDFNEVDKIRTKTIVHLLKNWNLIEVVNSKDVDEILSEKIDVINHKEKGNFTIEHKFKFYKKIVID